MRTKTKDMFETLRDHIEHGERAEARLLTQVIEEQVGDEIKGLQHALDFSYLSC